MSATLEPEDLAPAWFMVFQALQVVPILVDAGRDDLAEIVTAGLRSVGLPDGVVPHELQEAVIAALREREAVSTHSEGTA